MTDPIAQPESLSDMARRSKFPLAYTWLAGDTFDHPEWSAYATGMTQLVRQNMYGGHLKYDVRRHFDQVLLKLGGG